VGVRRHTKIIATLGPASTAPDRIAQLIAAGVDVFRLNFSHGTHDSHARSYRDIRAVAAANGRHVAILQDLSGPKIRIGSLRNGEPIELQEGESLRIASGDGIGGPGRVFTTYRPLISAVRPGARLLLDDGRIELTVIDRTGDEIETRVVHGGHLGEHKGINAPGVRLPAGALTPKDEEDLRFGLELGVDLVALSFVQTPDDVLTARAVVERAGHVMPLIAKIERPEGVENLEAIARVADGLMVARGDLGLECPLEHVPRIQKQIIRLARANGIPVIVATQVLESMRTEPRPTRAEVSDAATAVDQNADAIMLAGETAVGAFPVRAVQTLAGVICEAERLPAPDPTTGSVLPSAASRHGRALCEAAVTLATTGEAEAIVAVTRGGQTARLLSCLRPRALILGITSSEQVASRLALLWGVTPLVCDGDDPAALARTIGTGADVSANAVVVFVNVSPDLGREDANYLNLQRLDQGPDPGGRGQVSV
jgi:pyruvate kinase